MIPLFQRTGGRYCQIKVYFINAIMQHDWWWWSELVRWPCSWDVSFWSFRNPQCSCNNWRCSISGGNQGIQFNGIWSVFVTLPYNREMTFSANYKAVYTSSWCIDLQWNWFDHIDFASWQSLVSWWWYCFHYEWVFSPWYMSLQQHHAVWKRNVYKFVMTGCGSAKVTLNTGMWKYLTNQPSFCYMYQIQGNYEKLT